MGNDGVVESVIVSVVNGVLVVLISEVVSVNGIVLVEMSVVVEVRVTGIVDFVEPIEITEEVTVGVVFVRVIISCDTKLAVTVQHCMRTYGS